MVKTKFKVGKSRDTEVKSWSWIWKNIRNGLIFLVGLFLIVRIVLLIITQHHFSVSVPDFTGKSMAKCEKLASKARVKLCIVDSVYVSGIEKGAVFSQNPSAGSKVKHGRTVYLTTNAVNDKMVLAPDLVGYSLRQAQVDLMSKGLKLGKLMYVRDIATNNVLGAFINGESVVVSEPIKVGTTIDLQLGLNYEDGYTEVPNILGQTRELAETNLKYNGLNVRVHFDGTVKDMYADPDAFVYLTVPQMGQKVILGSTISIYLTLNAARLPKTLFSDESTELK